MVKLTNFCNLRPKASYNSLGESMSISFLIIKVAFYGLFGYFLFGTINRGKSLIKGKYFLNYCLFSLITVASETGHILVLAIGGIFWGLLLKIFFDVIDEHLLPPLNPLWFGLLNIFNHYVLEYLFDQILCLIPKNITIVLSIIFTLYFIIDISYTMRKVT